MEVPGVETRSSKQTIQPPYLLSYVVSLAYHNVRVPGEAVLQVTTSILQQTTKNIDNRLVA